MNADAFRDLYKYHFAENRSLWDGYILQLPEALFTQPSEYSVGSVRNQVVHLMNVDNSWFHGLRGLDIPEWMNPCDFTDMAHLRARWDAVEQMMRGYLADLRDEMLFSRPFTDDEDKDLMVWQVLLHVVNHGTDHRAQALRLLHDLGVKTGPQDYMFYVYDHPSGDNVVAG